LERCVKPPRVLKRSKVRGDEYRGNKIGSETLTEEVPENLKEIARRLGRQLSTVKGGWNTLAEKLEKADELTNQPRRDSQIPNSGKHNFIIDEKCQVINQYYSIKQRNNELPDVRGTTKGGTFSPSPMRVVTQTIEFFLKNRPDAKVLDCGSGTNKVVALFSLYASYVKGIEIDEDLYKLGLTPINDLSEEKIIDKGKIELVCGDFLKEDFSKYDLIYIYWPYLHDARLRFRKSEILYKQLEEKLLQELRPNARFVFVHCGEIRGEIFSRLERIEDPAFPEGDGLVRIRAYRKQQPLDESQSQKGIKFDSRSQGSTYIPVIFSVMVIFLLGIAACFWPQISAHTHQLQAAFGSSGHGLQSLASLGGFMGMLFFGRMAVDIGGRVMGIPMRYRVIGLEEMTESVRNLVKELYRQVCIVREYLGRVTVFRLPEVLALGIVRKVGKTAVEIGQKFVPVILQQPSEKAARWSFTIEEGFFSGFLLNFLPWFVAVCGFLDPSHFIWFYLASNLLYGISHTSRFHWQEDGTLKEIKLTTFKDKIIWKTIFTLYGFGFRIGYLIPGLGPILGPIIAFGFHAFWSNVVTRYIRFLPLGMATSVKKEDEKVGRPDHFDPRDDKEIFGKIGTREAAQALLDHRKTEADPEVQTAVAIGMGGIAPEKSDALGLGSLDNQRQFYGQAAAHAKMNRILPGQPDEKRYFNAYVALNNSSNLIKEAFMEVVGQNMHASSDFGRMILKHGSVIYIDKILLDFPEGTDLPQWIVDIFEGYAKHIRMHDETPDNLQPLHEAYREEIAAVSEELLHYIHLEEREEGRLDGIQNALSAHLADRGKDLNSLLVDEFFAQARELMNNSDLYSDGQLTHEGEMAVAAFVARHYLDYTGFSLEISQDGTRTYKNPLDEVIGTYTPPWVERVHFLNEELTGITDRVMARCDLGEFSGGEESYIKVEAYKRAGEVRTSDAGLSMTAAQIEDSVAEYVENTVIPFVRLLDFYCQGLPEQEFEITMARPGYSHLGKMREALLYFQSGQNGGGLSGVSIEGESIILRTKKSNYLIQYMLLTRLFEGGYIVPVEEYSREVPLNWSDSINVFIDGNERDIAREFNLLTLSYMLGSRSRFPADGGTISDTHLTYSRYGDIIAVPLTFSGAEAYFKMEVELISKIKGLIGGALLASEAEMPQDELSRRLKQVYSDMEEKIKREYYRMFAAKVIPEELQILRETYPPDRNSLQTALNEILQGYQGTDKQFRDYLARYLMGEFIEREGDKNEYLKKVLRVLQYKKLDVHISSVEQYRPTLLSDFGIFADIEIALAIQNTEGIVVPDLLKKEGSIDIGGAMGGVYDRIHGTFSSEDEKRAYIRFIGRIGGREAIIVLHALLRSGLPITVAQECIKALADIGTPEAAEIILSYDKRQRNKGTSWPDIVVILLSGIAACFWPEISAQALKLRACFGSPGNGAQLASLGGFIGMLFFGGVAVDIGGRVMGIPVRYRVIGLKEMIESVRDLVKELYRQICITKEYLVKVAVFRLPEALALGIARKVGEPVVEIGRRFIAVILHQPSERAELRLSWFGVLRQKLPEEEITEIMALVEELNERKEVAQLSGEESPYRGNKEINRLLEWTPLVKEMEGRVRGIEEFVKEVRGNYKRVEVIGEETIRAIEVREISPEETLFMVPYAGRPYEYVYGKLTEFYRSQGIPAGEIESKVGEHFIWIGEASTAFGEEAGKMESLRRFNRAEGLLVLLKLRGVNIESFLKGVKKGMAMCKEKNVNNNPGAQLLILQEAMRKAGRNRILLVLPEELKGFAKAWGELIPLLGREGKGIIPILEEELASAESYGKNTAFIHVNVGAGLHARTSGSTGVALASLRKAGYPVFEIPLGSKEDIGALFYIAEFASVTSYLMGISRSRKSGSLRASFKSGTELSPAKAAGLGRTKAEPFLEYQIRPEVFGGKVTQVVAVDLDALLEMELDEEPTHSMMRRNLRVRPKSIGALKVMKNIIDAAKEEENLRRVNFAFICSKQGVTKEVMELMLRDHMSACGLSTEDVARIVNKELIIDQETLSKAGGLVGISRTRKISAKAVFSIITERLLGSTGGNGIKVSIVTDSEDRWKKDGEDEIMERILWVLLKPAGEGEGLSTAAGLVVAIEGKVSKWLIDFIKKNYPEQAEKLLPRISRDGKIILPATPVDKNYLEEIKDQEKVYKVEA